MSKIDILHKTCLFLAKRLGDFYMAEKMDRRVRKTKAQLREGLARLMQQKSIKEISVKELVDEVDINRSTFYLHYTDIYQMLQKIEEDAMQNITEVMKKYPINSDNPDTVLQFIVQFFSIMDNDRDLCLALLGPHGDMAFVEQIENLLAETFLKQLPDKFPKNDPNIKYPYAFILNGCVGLIRTWLSCPTNESPEQVARLIYRLIEDTTQGYLNMQK